jgi:MFS family permease
MKSINPSIDQIEKNDLEKLIQIFSGLTFLIFFQIFMIAPLIPNLAKNFGVDIEKMGFIVPAYLFPYGLATLCYGFISDFFGQKKIIIFH